jgi:hypothetical protein
VNMMTVAKAFGVTIPEENVRQLEQLIPLLPGKIREIVSVTNEAIQNFDQRLQTLESRTERIESKIDQIGKALGIEWQTNLEP